MLNLYTGGSQVGTQHQVQVQSNIQPPQLLQQSQSPSSSFLSSSHLGQVGAMSMSMSGQQQQPQSQGQNVQLGMQNSHPLSHQLPHGHLQPQRGVMITPQHPHQQPRGFPPGVMGPSGGGPVGAGPGTGLMPNPNLNPNSNAPTVAGMYSHGPATQGQRRMPGAPGSGPSNQPPSTAVMSGMPMSSMMGMQIPMQQHPHQPHQFQHGAPPNQQLPPHLNQQSQQPSQQPPHPAQQGQSSHLGHQSMNINNPLQHPPQPQGQQSNTGLPPSITGQLRQGGANSRMLANHGLPPGTGSGNGGAGSTGDMSMNMGIGGMGMPAIGMSGMGIPVGIGRGQAQSQQQHGSQSMNGVTVMGRGGGPSAPSMGMMNLGMGGPQPGGQGHPQGVGMPHRAQPQQQQQPPSQGQPFGLATQHQHQPQSSQQPPNMSTGNLQQQGQQAPLSYNLSHIQQPPGHGNIHAPGPSNPAITGHPNSGAPSPGRPATGTPATPGRSAMMGNLRAQNQQVGQVQQQGQQGPSLVSTQADIMNSFAHLQQQHQQQHQHQQMLMNMSTGGDFGPSAGAGGRVGMQGMQQHSGGGFFIPDPHAHTSNPTGNGGPTPISATQSHTPNPNQPGAGGPPNAPSPFTHGQSGQSHQLSHSSQPQHSGAGVGMHMGQPPPPPQQQHLSQSHPPHPSTPHHGAPGSGPGRPHGVQIQHGGVHPHSQQHNPQHGQPSHGHPHQQQISGAPASRGSTPSANPNAPSATTPGTGVGSGPGVMIPHPNTANNPPNMNAPGGPSLNTGPGGRRMAISGNLMMGMNMGMGMMFGGPGGDGQSQNQGQGQTLNGSTSQGTPPQLPNQGFSQGQHPIPGQAAGQAPSRSTPRPPSRHLPPNVAQPGGGGPMGMGPGRGTLGAGGVPLPNQAVPGMSIPNAPGPHPPGRTASKTPSASPQIRRTSLPPSVPGENAVAGPSSATTSGPGGISPLHPAPHGPVMRPPMQFPPVVGAGQGLVRVLSFSGAIGVESDERLTRNYWSKIVHEYFAPHSSWKLTLWKDNDRREAKLFEICPDVITMLLAVSSQAGVKSMSFVLDNAQERPINLGVSIVECSEARWIWRFKDGHTIVLKGTFSVQVAAYHNPAVVPGAAANVNAANAPGGGNGVNGPTPGTPGRMGTPHPPHVHLPSSQPQLPYLLKFDSMAFVSFLHDRLLDLDCIFGQKMSYSSSSLAAAGGGMGLSDSPRTQGHKTTPSTTTQGSPDIAPASTSSSGSNPANAVSGNGNVMGSGINIKTEENQGQGQGLMQNQGSGLVQGSLQGQNMQTHGQVQAAHNAHSPAGIGGGGSGGIMEERIVIEQAVLPAEPINAFGIPQVSMRCLELAESVGQMTDLFHFCRQSKMGPKDALQVFATQIKAQSHGLDPGSTMGGGGMGPMVMGPGMMSGGPMGMNMTMGAGSVGLMGYHEAHGPTSSSLGSGGGQGQSPHAYGYPHGQAPSHNVGTPQASLHGQPQSQSQAQLHQNRPQPQSQSQAHTPQSAQHTPQLTQLTKPTGQFTPQNQNQSQAVVSQSPRQPATQPSTPKTTNAGPGGGGTGAQTTGHSTAVGQGTGTAMKRKAPDTSNPSVGQSDPTQPPAKRVTRRKSKVG